jgi:hypothetical protein
VFDAQMLSHESVLSSHVVKECDFGKRLDVGVGGRGGLPIAEQGGDNYEVFLWAQGFIFSDEPFVVGNCLGYLSAGVP